MTRSPDKGQQLDQEEHQALTAESRSWLAALAREPIAWGPKRPLPADLGTLVNRGFAFRSHFNVTITEKGLEVLERVS